MNSQMMLRAESEAPALPIYQHYFTLLQLFQCISLKSPKVTPSLGSGCRNGSRATLLALLIINSDTIVVSSQCESPSIVCLFPLPKCSVGNSCLSLSVITAH